MPLLAVALTPLTLAAIPGLIDYPNHLARLFILANHGRMEALRLNYRLDWGVKPNLAMDLMVPPLTAWMAPETAGRLFLVLMLLLLAGGTAALARALHGRVGVLPLLAVPLLFNLMLGAGFVNFLFGGGVMLLALAGWVATGHWPAMRRGAVFIPAVTALFFSHLFALACFLAAAAAFEAGRRRRQGLIALAIAALPLPPLWALRPAGVSGVVEFGGLADHALALAAPLFLGAGWSDAAVAPALLAVGAGLVAAGRGRPFVPAMEAPIALLALLAVLMPSRLMGGHAVDMRLPVLLAFVAVAALRPALLPARLAPLFVAAIAVMTVARSVDAGLAWRAVDAQFAEFRAASRVIAPGARVLAFHDDLQNHRAHQHLAALAIIERCAYVPHLAKMADQQPIAAIDRAVDSGNLGDPVGPREFAEGADPKAPAPPLPAGDLPYWLDWPHRYDYVVHADWGAHGNPRPDLLERVGGGSFFEIFQVRTRPPPPPAKCHEDP